MSPTIMTPGDVTLREVDLPVYPFQLTRNRKLNLPLLAMADFPTIGNSKSLVITLKSVPLDLPGTDPQVPLDFIRGNVDSDNWGGWSGNGWTGRAAFTLTSFGGQDLLSTMTFFCAGDEMYNNVNGNQTGTAPTVADPERVWTITFTVNNIDDDNYGCYCKIEDDDGFSVESPTPVVDPRVMTNPGLASMTGSLRLYMGDVKGFIDSAAHDVTVLSVVGWE